MSYHKAELYERLVIKYFMLHLKCANYSVTPIGSKKPYDFKFIHDEQHYICELKCLSTPHDKYDSMLLQLDKARGLVFEKFKDNLDAIILYIHYYSNGYCRVLRITPPIAESNVSWITVNKKLKPVLMVANDNASLFRFDVPKIKTFNK